MVNESLALEILLLLLENPSDDSVEVASQFLQEVGRRCALCVGGGGWGDWADDKKKHLRMGW